MQKAELQLEPHSLNPAGGNEDIGFFIEFCL